MTQMTDFSAARVTGHVLIRDRSSGAILADQHNAIHLENFVLTMARGLADLPTGHIYQMVFGNGASVTTATGEIQYFMPNVSGSGATLYNQTYQKVVDQYNGGDSNPAENAMAISHTTNTSYADLVVTCTLDLDEPAGQDPFDTASSASAYVFDEIGLVASGTSNLLLSHVIFNPVQKALNRVIDVVYTVRLAMA